MKCDRCGKDTSAFIGSMFNKQMICLNCKMAEEMHPQYEEACRRDLEAIQKGNLNYEGIGLPPELATEQTITEWDRLAHEILRVETSTFQRTDPPSEGVIIHWLKDDQFYLGSLQQVYPEYPSPIFLLSKASTPSNPELIHAIERKAPHRRHLIGDATLDLEGRHHFLTVTDTDLLVLDSEATAYVLAHPPLVYDEEG